MSGFIVNSVLLTATALPPTSLITLSSVAGDVFLLDKWDKSTYVPIRVLASVTPGLDAAVMPKRFMIWQKAGSTDLVYIILANESQSSKLMDGWWGETPLGGAHVNSQNTFRVTHVTSEIDGEVPVDRHYLIYAPRVNTITGPQSICNYSIPLDGGIESFVNQTWDVSAFGL